MSPLSALAAENPAITISDSIREQTDREFDQRMRPYRAGLTSERLTRRGR